MSPQPTTPKVRQPRRQPAPDDSAAVLDQAVVEQIDDLVAFRRALHARPEPSGQERQTTALVAEELRAAGLEPRVMSGGLGVVADIDLGAPATGGGPRFIALRAELDCVGVNDEKTAPYASTRAGCCHACGHDAHTAMVLAAAKAIMAVGKKGSDPFFQRNVRLIFQPAEETAAGARSMIQQGAIENVEAILALHVDTSLPVGRIGVRHGPMTAACELFKIDLRGRGGHSARPHEAIDPIPAAAMLVSQLYQLCPRAMDTRHPLSLTVGSLIAGHAPNVIPDQAAITGTLRTTRTDDTQAIQRTMKAIVEGVGASTGCDIGLLFTHSCPPTSNDRRLVEALVETAAQMLGSESVQWIELPSMGGEDFAFYQQRIPGVFARLGAAPEDPSARHPLHSSRFDINEAALPIGARLLARTAARLARADHPTSVHPGTVHPGAA